MFSFTVNNNDITNKVVAGSCTIERIFCENQLELGQPSSAQMKLKTTEDLELTGATIIVKNGLDEVGRYTVTYSAKIQNSEQVSITAYDALKKFDTNVADWYGALSFPISASNMFASLCTYVGVTSDVQLAVNQNIMLERTIEPSNLNGLELLGKLAEIFATMFYADEGKVKNISLSNRVGESLTVTAGANAFSSKDYDVAPIKRLTIRQTSDDTGATVGSGTNTFYITGNYLLYGNSNITTIATNILSELLDISIRPCEITVPYATYQPGFFNYSGKKFFAMSMSIDSNKITMKCSGEQYLVEGSSTKTELEQLKGQSNVIKNDLNGLSQTVQTINSDYVTTGVLNSTSNAINASIQEINREVQELADAVDGNATVYNLDYEPTKLNYPYWDWTENIPCNDTVQLRDDLAFIYNEASLRKHIRTLVFDTTTNLSYRFVREENEFTWKAISESDFGIAMARIAEVQVEADEIRLDVNAQDLVITAQGNRITTAESSLSTQAQSIEAKVSKSDGTSDSNASWNLTPTAFSVSSKGREVLRVDGSGVTISGYATSGDVTNSADAVKTALRNGTTQVSGSAIIAGSLAADRIEANSLIVGENVLMGANAEINWSKVNGKPDVATQSQIPTKLSQLSNTDTGYVNSNQVESQITNKGYQTSEQVTTITRNTVTTSYVNALKVKAGSVDAENISGTTISGKKIVSSELSSSTITGTLVNQGMESRMEIGNGEIDMTEDAYENIIAADKVELIGDKRVRLTNGALRFLNDNDGVGSGKIGGNIEFEDEVSAPFLIQSGKTTVSSTAINVFFGTNKSFKTVPNVVASFASTNTSAPSISGTIQIYNVRTDGFKIKLVGGSGSQTVHWIATA